MDVSIERALETYKQYVRNKARPKGSIAEVYIVNESLTFCSIYLRGMKQDSIIFNEIMSGIVIWRSN